MRYIAVVLAAIFLISAGLMIIDLVEKKDTNTFEDDGETVKTKLTYKGQKYVLKDELDTFLIMGLDKTEEYIDNSAESYNNDSMDDFIMLFVINNADSTCNAVQINRDTIAEMDILGVAGDKVGTTNKQIAYAHTYGNGKGASCRNVATAVSRMFDGIKIDHYLSVTVDSVPIYNDLLGGVEVEIKDDFTGVDDTLVMGEKVTLMGAHAENFVRGRHGVSDSTNLNRLARQRDYMYSAFEKTRSCINEDSGFVKNACLKMSKYMISNCSGQKLQNLLKRVCDYSLSDILTIDGEIKQGEKYIEFYPDEDSLNEIKINLFYEKE